MFEWLQAELREIKTNKFHVVDGPAGKRLRKAIKTSKLAAPRAYKDFALQFGNANLYRQDDYVDRYHVVVLASMRDAEHKESSLRWFGEYAGRSAYFKEELLNLEDDSPVFEWVVGPYSHLQQVADGFVQWLEKRCQSAKKKYTKRRWKELVSGPEPLTAKEQQVVKARSKFRWRVVGIAKNGALRFEVKNDSAIVLPYLTIGVDNEQRSIRGAIFLPTSDVRPGQTKIVEHRCYKGYLRPEEHVAFDFPAPGPEDRGRYAEFDLPNNR